MFPSDDAVPDHHLVFDLVDSMGAHREGARKYTYALCIGVFGFERKEQLLRVPVEQWRKVCV